MPNYCYLNGKILPFNKAKIDLNDIGVLRGYGVFEFLRTYNGKPFLLNRHLARFSGSARTLNLKIPINKQKVTKVINELLIKNNLMEAGIKLVLTGGPSNDGISYSSNLSTFFILVSRPNVYSPSLYQKGAKLITCEHQREFPLAKTTNYLAAISLQETRKKKGAVDVLYTSNGFVSECSRSSFFLFKNGRLITAGKGVLQGITRELVIKLAGEKFPVEQRPTRISELKSADETFVTSTDKEVLPVVKIDDIIIGNGRVGKNTKILMDLFRFKITNLTNKSKHIS